METTIGETISRVRNIMKAVKEDAFVTDRFLYSLILKYGKAFIKMQKDQDQIQKLAGLYKSVPCVELIPVDKIEACCGGVKTNCIIMRTKNKLPDVMSGESGPMFRTLFSIDGSIEVHPTEPRTYTAMANSTTFKYNKKKYYWYINNYLYFPNISWPSVKIEAIWEGDISSIACDAKDGKEDCPKRQDQLSAIPDYLFAEVEKQVLQELGITTRIPPDLGGDDKQSIYR